jgi:putative cardiolipin synthase
LDAEISALQAHPNVEVRLWNPFTARRFKKLSFAVDFFRLNRRMHNKSFTVDGHASVLGGRNIGDEYFNTGSMPLSVDLDVLVVGEVVPQISADFDRYWNSGSAYPAAQIITKTAQVDPILSQLARFKSSEQMAKYRGMLEQSSFLTRLNSGSLDFEWTQVTLVSDDPAKGQGALPREKLLTGLMAKAVGDIEHKFDGVTPYFVPGKEGVEAFTGLVKEGVDVRILTNSLEATDVLPVHAGYAKRRKKLLDGGVGLFEMRRHVAANEETKKLGPFGSSASSLHAKTFAVDGKKIFVGSFNFDPRSARLNTEMGLLIESERLAQGLHTVFDSGLNGTAWQVKLADNDLLWLDPESIDGAPLAKEPGSNIWRNAALKLIGWLPVEWLL